MTFKVQDKLLKVCMEVIRKLNAMWIRW